MNKIEAGVIGFVKGNALALGQVEAILASRLAGVVVIPASAIAEVKASVAREILATANVDVTDVPRFPEMVGDCEAAFRAAYCKGYISGLHSLFRE